MKSFSIIGCSILLVIAVALLWTANTYTPAITSDDGAPLPNSIAEERRVLLGGDEQYVLIRGVDRNAPVLVFLHGGPGTSAMAFNRVFSSDLEEDFVFINWDQRGTGYSLSAADNLSTLTLEQMTEDLNDLIQTLQKEFNQDKIYLVGYSWGSLLGLNYISQYPEDVHAYIGIGQLADTPASEKAVYDWAMQQALDANDDASVTKLNNIGAPPYDSVTEMMTHRGVSNLYGGAWLTPMTDVKYALTAIKAPEFSWTGLRDILRGGDISLEALFDTFRNFDGFAAYPSVDIPIYFVHGRHDRVVSPDVAANYLDKISAPYKEFIWFENSAHSPQWEEPEKYRQVLRKIAAQHR